MDKIVVRNTCIIINDYNMGDCDDLEKCFKIFDPITHKFNFIGLYYNSDTKQLFLPAGLDLWKIKGYFGEKYYKRETNHPYTSIPEIKMKYFPRDERQQEALRFSCGVNEYAENAYLPQLSINLNTGVGKTYVSIATIAFYKIKSIIITGSNTLLSQWKSEILKYTNIPEDRVMQINGSPMINLIMSGKSKASDASILLCTHGTLRSYADQYGWNKIYELFEYLGIGLVFFDEAHTNFENMLLIEFHTNVFKTYLVSATMGRSDWKEDKVFQLSIKNVPYIDLFDDSLKHTSYVAIKWNSHPSAQQISACKNKYGLDRMKYVDYITKQPSFYQMMRIIMDLVIKCKGRVLIYIGTNEGILRVYHWIATEYNEFLGDIGIFTSLVSKEEKMEEKKKKILLSTTKSAGVGEHIEGLKMTIVLAEPFKSSIIARQTLGRTRDDNTLYVELVDVGFVYIKKFYNAKLDTFNKYATDVSDTLIDQYELNRRSETIISKRKKPGTIHPIKFHDERFDFSNLENNPIYNEDSNSQAFNIANNPYLR